MKKALHICLLLILPFMVLQCEKENVNLVKDDNSAKQDSLFIESIIDDSNDKTISRIENMLNSGEYSDHRVAIMYLQKGIAFLGQRKYIESIGSLKKALAQFEKEGDKRKMAWAHKLIGDSYAFTLDKKRALKHVSSALEIYKELDDKEWEAIALNSLSHVYYIYEDQEMSYKCLLEAKDIQEAIGDSAAIAKSYGNIGYVLESMGRYDEALAYYSKSMTLNEKIDKDNTQTLRNIAGFYMDREMISESREMFLKALDIEERQDNFSKHKEIYDGLLHLSILDKSYDHSMLYKEKSDSLANLISERDNKKKIELVEKEYALMARDQELEQAKNINNKNKIIFVIVFALLTLAGLYFYQRNKNAKLQLVQDKIVLEQEVLRSQMNPHFIFNALSAIQNSLMENEPMKTASYLSRFAKLIRQNFDFVKKSSIRLSEELDSLRNYMDTQKLRFSDRFDYKIHIDDEIDAYETNIPPLLLQPFIENSIEHGFKNKQDLGLIEINIRKEDHTICYEIKDNGQGYKRSTGDGKTHAIDVFKKRLKLLDHQDQKPLKINTSDKGTTINFCLPND